MSANQKPLTLEPTAETWYAVRPTPQSTEVTAPPKEEVWGVLHPISSYLKPIQLSGAVTTIGRSSDNDVEISGGKISAKHCTIKWNGHSDKSSYVVVTDHSRNGTWINEDMITKDQFLLLKESNEITFGRHPNLDEDPLYNHRYIYRHIATPPTPGTLYALYDVGYELGRGSFGVVMSGVARATGVWHAIKMIRPPKELIEAYPHDEEARNKVTKFLREVQILEQLDHKNICKLEEAFFQGWDIALVLEYVNGGDLFDYMQTYGVLDEATTGRIVYQIVDALCYIHAKDIAHRDLKPENILLTSEDPPVVKVADFGLAKVVEGSTFLKTKCGTAAYVAPEILTRTEEEGYDYVVDSWSVGVIAHHMLTGMAPFIEDSSIEDLTTRIISRTIYWETLEDMDLSRNVKNFVRALLREDPTFRMSISDALHHPWLAAFKPTSGQETVKVMADQGVTHAAASELGVAHATVSELGFAHATVSEVGVTHATASDLQHEQSVEALLTTRGSDDE
ncbi:kinase-like protein [Coniophora puteana RWD-64-598 SS2]|uniref:Kinase-like protein n=1 Tax=Coniophora puteana (strain RWD-64-598) TaxID=741705 RepID=A0A5M3MEI7_CONPW|nr:kinase-like protein [Coniophora puteana RWD-64-598 SS2]EIW77642.1 kinase-like protein [Coniophora puteana RWD-64-598 SS2]